MILRSVLCVTLKRLRQARPSMGYIKAPVLDRIKTLQALILSSKAPILYNPVVTLIYPLNI